MFVVSAGEDPEGGAAAEGAGGAAVRTVGGAAGATSHASKSHNASHTQKPHRGAGACVCVRNAVDIFVALKQTEGCICLNLSAEIFLTCQSPEDR